MARQVKQDKPTESKPLRQRFQEGIKKINDAYDPVPRIKKFIGGQQEGYQKATKDRIDRQVDKADPPRKKKR